MLDKSQLRKKIFQQRKSSSLSFQQSAADAITTSLLSIVEQKKASTVALYCAADGEVKTDKLISALLLRDCVVLLPVMLEEKTMAFYQYNGDALLKNQYGIPEPDVAGRSPFSLQAIDMMCLPLVAFDSHCSRVGRGGGYYDRILAKAGRSMMRVGLAYAFQEVVSCDPESHDQQLDIVVTERATFSNL